jgi:hypothetical protein
MTKPNASLLLRVVPLSALDTLLGVDTNAITQGLVIDSRLNVRQVTTTLAKKIPISLGLVTAQLRVRLDMKQSPVSSTLILCCASRPQKLNWLFCYLR